MSLNSAEYYLIPATAFSALCAASSVICALSGSVAVRSACAAASVVFLSASAAFIYFYNKNNKKRTAGLEAQSRSIRERFKKPIDELSSYIACVTVKEDDIILDYANERSMKLAGIDEKFFGKSVFKITGVERKNYVALFKQGIADKKSFSFFYTLKHPAVEPLSLRIDATYSETGSGSPFYFCVLIDVTENIRLKKQLEQTVASLEDASLGLKRQSYYQSIIETYISGITIVKRASEDRVCDIYISDNASNILQVPYERIKEQLENPENRGILREYAHPGDLGRLTDIEHEICSTLPGEYSYQFRVLRADGEYIWLECRLKRIPNSDEYVGLYMDMTREKQTENELLIREEQYRIACQISKRVIQRYDLVEKRLTTIADFKSSVRPIMDMANVPESLIENGVIGKDSATQVRLAFADMFNGVANGSFEFEYDDKTGRGTLWLECHYSLITDSAGKPVSAILTYDNISDSHEQEDFFKQNMPILSAYSGDETILLIYNISADAIEYIRGSINGRPEAAQLRGASLYETFKTVAHLVDSEDLNTVSANITREKLLNAAETGSFECSYDVRFHVSDGVDYWYVLYCSLYSGGHKKMPKLFCVLYNITEQKKIELELSRRNSADPLTGLLNSDAFTAKAEAKFAALSSNGPKAAVVSLNIDGFSEINKMFGFSTADEVLKYIGGRIRECCSDSDLASRPGAANFSVAFFGLKSLGDVLDRCRLLKDAISGGSCKGITVTASIGAAAFPDDGEDFADLSLLARQAMYNAHDKGGNRYMRCDPISRDSGQNAAQDDILPPAETVNHVYIRTFGFFDVFINGVPLHFSGAKEKELLAILVDLNGESISSDDAAALLWPELKDDEKLLSLYRKTAMHLRNTLKDLDIENILVVEKGLRHIEPSRFECDYYNYLKGDPEFVKLFRGVYMTSYQWAEPTLNALNGGQNASKGSDRQ